MTKDIEEFERNDVTQGLPPHTRGRPAVMPEMVIDFRITPAHAGKMSICSISFPYEGYRYEERFAKTGPIIFLFGSRKRYFLQKHFSLQIRFTSKLLEIKLVFLVTANISTYRIEDPKRKSFVQKER